MQTAIYLRLASLNKEYSRLDKEYNILLEMAPKSADNSKKTKLMDNLRDKMNELDREMDGLRSYVKDHFIVKITNTNSKESLEGLVTREVIDDYLKGKAVKSMRDWGFWDFVLSSPRSYWHHEQTLNPNEILPKDETKKPLRVEYGVQKDKDGGCLVFLADNNPKTTRIKGDILQVPIEAIDRKNMMKDKRSVRTY